MNRRNAVLAFGAVVLAAAAVAFATWFLRPPATPMRTSDSTSSGNGMRVVLVPIQSAETKPWPEADVWRDLFVGMTRDEDVATFLQRLYGGLEVELSAPAPATTEPPRTGYSVVLRIDPKQVESNWNQVVARLGGRSDQPVQCLLGTLDFSRVAKLQFPAAGDERMQAIASALESNFDDINAFVMAANDHLLRQQAGWRIVNGLGVTADQLKSYSTDPAEVRRELEQQAEQWTKRYQAKTS